MEASPERKKQICWKKIDTRTRQQSNENNFAIMEIETSFSSYFSLLIKFWGELYNLVNRKNVVI